MRGKNSTKLGAALLGIAGLAVCAIQDTFAQFECNAVVTLQFEQRVTLVRQGFRATLTINNLTDKQLNKVAIDFSYIDAAGKKQNALFFEKVTLLSKIVAIDRSDAAIVSANTTAKIEWLIIPSVGAGGVSPVGVKYNVGALLRYEFDGTPVVVPAKPVSINVKPQPDLELTYSIPKRVTGEEPFPLSVRIHNVGAGAAVDFIIKATEPEIVSSVGAPLSFEVVEAKVRGVSVQNSLLLDFGTIEPDQVVVGEWDMKTKASGTFLDFDATFSHSAELGGAATSPISKVDKFILVRRIIVDVGTDIIRDYLDDTDKDGVPDTIVESEGENLPVTVATGSIVGAVGPGTASFTVLVSTATGWMLTEVPDPTDGTVPPVQVIRSDSKVLNPINFWVEEGKLRILDFNSTGSYSVTLNPLGFDEKPPESRVQAGLPSFGVDPLVVSSSTPLSFLVSDDLSGLSFTRYRIDAGTFTTLQPFLIQEEGPHVIEFFSEDRAGNRESTQTVTIEVDSTLPVAAISTPSAGAFLRGLVEISGTASDLHFAQYRLQASSGDAFVTLATSTETRAGTLLGRWDTTQFSDGTHTLRLIAQDVLDFISTTTVTIAIDNTAPVSEISISSPQVSLDGDLFVTSRTSFTLSAEDPVVDGSSSGVSGIFLAVEVSTTLPPSFAELEPPSIFQLGDGDGRRFISFFAEDNAGNREVVQSTTAILDNTPPLITISSPTAGQVFIGLTSTVTIQFEVTDNFDPSPQASALLVQIEDRGFPRGTRPNLIPVTSGELIKPLDIDDGTWRLEVSASDFIENSTKAVSGAFEVIHDILPPRSTVDIGEPKFSTAPVFLTQASSITLRSEDDLIEVGDKLGLGVTFQVASLKGITVDRSRDLRFDNASPVQGQVFVSTFTASEEPDGLYALETFAEDVIGNREEIRITTVAVDNTPSQTQIVVGIPRFVDPNGKEFITSKNFIVFKATDPIVNEVASGVALTEFSIDNGTFTVFSASFTLTQGIHQVAFRSVDNLGNREETKTVVLHVDDTAPVTELVQSGQFFVDSSSRSFARLDFTYQLEAEDPVVEQVASGVALTKFRTLTVPGTQDALGTPEPPLPKLGLFDPLAPPFTLDEGIKRVDFQSQDNVLNLELLKSATIFVDGTAPISGIEISTPQATLADGTTLLGPQTPLLIVSSDPVSNGVASGVQDSFVAVDTDTFVVAPGTFTLPAPDGLKTIQFFSRDNVLNAEAAKSTSVILDATPPDIALFSPPAPVLGLCSVFKGTFPVLGRAVDAHFKSYQLEFATGTDATSGFVLVSSSSVGISSGTLDVWDTSTLSGFHTLRLTATDLVENDSVLSVNVFIGDPGRQLVLGSQKTFNKPHGVAVGPAGQIYVADTNNDRIQVFSSTGVPIAAFGSGKPKEEPSLNKPKDLDVDAGGNIYVADTKHHRIAKLSPTGELLLEIGDIRVKKGKKSFRPGKEPGQFRHPSGIAVDKSGKIYVSDTDNRRVQVFDSSGTFILEFDLPSTKLLMEDDDEEDGDEEQQVEEKRGKLGKPFGIDVDDLGNIYVADPKGHRALKFDPTGDLRLTIGKKGKGPGEFRRPEGIAVSPKGDCIVVSDRKLARIQKFDAEGNLTLVFGQKGKIKEKKPLPEELVFLKPIGLALDSEGSLFVADRNNERIQKFGLPDGPTLVVSGRSATGGGVTTTELKAQADPTFKLGEVYVFPNPAEGGDVPNLHVEVGIAERVEIRIYDLAGDLMHQTTLTGTPPVIDDGQGPQYAYEYAWEGHIPSGVYIYLIEAHHDGAELKKIGRFSVIR